MKPAVIAFVACGLLAGPAVAGLPLLEAMKQVVDPAANAFWAAGNDPPEGESWEAADARWRAAGEGAATMEAYGRRLMSAEHSRAGEWNAFARMMVEAGAAGRAAVEQRDMDGAFAAGGQLYEACAGCHASYIPGR